jgi:hypothetical protein
MEEDFGSDALRRIALNHRLISEIANCKVSLASSFAMRMARLVLESRFNDTRCMRFDFI